ncbi:MAG: type II secretion system protein N [Betaproteobacteria bacterium]
MTVADPIAVGPRPSLPFAWRLAAFVATLAAAALLAWVIAIWGWRAYAPVPVTSPPPAAVEPWAPAIVAVPLFGRPAAATAAPASDAAATGVVLKGDTRLLGVFAGSDGDGWALFRFADRGPVLVRKGQDIATGVTLDAVRPEGVRVRDRGEVREIALRASAASAPAAAPPAPRNRAACAAPPGYRGAVYRINAELLSGMAAQAESWRAVLAPAAGALVVRDESGFATLLGLKAGDRLTSAGGIALATIDDMQVAVVRPLQASQPVRVTGTRDGKALEWLLVNAAACAG